MTMTMTTKKKKKKKMSPEFDPETIPFHVLEDGRRVKKKKKKKRSGK